jgi:hypothetical protein
MKETVDMTQTQQDNPPRDAVCSRLSAWLKRQVNGDEEEGFWSNVGVFLVLFVWVALICVARLLLAQAGML